MIKKYTVTRMQKAHIEADSQREAEEMADLLHDAAFGDSPAYITTEDIPRPTSRPPQRTAEQVARAEAERKLMQFTKLLLSGRVDSPHAESALERIFEAACANEPYEPDYAKWFMYWGAWTAGWEPAGDDGDEFSPMPAGFGGN